MNVSDHPTKVIDEVIAEVRAIKRGISERYGNNIDRLLASLISQEQTAGKTDAQQASAAQPATRPESKSEGSDKPQSTKNIP